MIAVGNKSDVCQFWRAVDKNDVGRFDVAMNKAAGMEVFKGLAQSHSGLNTLID